MRVIIKIIAWLVGATIGIVLYIIANEMLSERPNTVVQAIFGLIGGSIGWVLIGKKSVNKGKE